MCSAKVLFHSFWSPLVFWASLCILYEQDDVFLPSSSFQIWNMVPKLARFLILFLALSAICSFFILTITPFCISAIVSSHLFTFRNLLPGVWAYFLFLVLLMTLRSPTFSSFLYLTSSLPVNYTPLYYRTDPT